MTSMPSRFFDRAMDLTIQDVETEKLPLSAHASMGATLRGSLMFHSDSATPPIHVSKIEAFLTSSHLTSSRSHCFVLEEVYFIDREDEHSITWSWKVKHKFQNWRLGEHVLSFSIIMVPKQTFCRQVSLVQISIELILTVLSRHGVKFFLFFYFFIIEQASINIQSFPRSAYNHSPNLLLSISSLSQFFSPAQSVDSIRTIR